MLSLFVSLFCFLRETHAHFKILNPPSRYETTANNDGGAIQTGPCGSQGIHTGEIITTIQGNSDFTIEWRIIADHDNAPMRITLSKDGSDSYDCILLNNIPHPEGATAPINMQWTWKVPNIKCSQCAIRIEWFHGATENTCTRDIDIGNTWFTCADIVIQNS